MSLNLHTEIIINTNPQKVWEHLTDFSSYPSWNPFITSISGCPEKGNELEALIGGMKFKPEVLESVPNKKLVWMGKLLFKGLFDGKHSFELIEKEGSCKFIQSEKFTGILVPLFRKKLMTDTKKGFEEMNKALKQRAEK